MLKPSKFYEQHAAAVVGNKMVVVGGESGNKLLEDVQVEESWLKYFIRLRKYDHLPHTWSTEKV